MLLSQKTMIQVNPAYANILGHMCYAASKLWNIGNYERYHYEELKLPQYPDWYYQKSTHKGHLWYKSLPSQSAQEVLKQLDKSWKSFYELKRSGGIENPRPPRYKQDKMAITYMQNAIVHEVGSGQIRLSIPKQLREYMSLTYDIGEKYLFLENKIFQNTDVIKQIKIYPPNEKGKCQVIQLPSSSHKQYAERKAMDILKKVSEESREQLGLSVTVSIGVGYNKEEDSFERLFQRADQALYQAKKTGKGKYVSSID